MTNWKKIITRTEQAEEGEEMTGYERDIFYAANSLSIAEQVLLLEDAKEMCTKWWADELDCRKSWARKRIDMGWDEALDEFKLATGFRFFSFIHRRGYPEWPHRLEVGYRISRQEHPGDLFLWVYVPEELIGLLTGKWGIKPMEAT